MRRGNVVLTVCLMVVFIAIGGLTVQSCRSTNVQRTIREQVDSAGKNSLSVEKSNDSLLRLLKLNKWALSYNVEYYIPVMDSTGCMTGTMLARKESMQVAHEESSDSVAETKSRTKEKSESESAMKRDFKENLNEEKKARASPVLVIIGLLGLILLAMFVWKKILPRFLN